MHKAAWMLVVAVSAAQAGETIPHSFVGGWAGEDYHLQAALVRPGSVRLVYESGGSALCVPTRINVIKPGFFRDTLGVNITCRGVDMARLRSYNSVFSTNIQPADVEWSVYLNEIEAGFEIEVMSCLAPIDDSACPKAVLYRAN
jgi:hypothetical protein